MKRLSLCVSFALLFISFAFASDPVQFNALNVEKSFQYPFKGQWLPAADPLYVGVENYTTLQNMRYTDASLETVEGYSKVTTNALGSGAYTILSGFPYNTDSGSDVITKVNNSSTYQLYERRTAIPSTGDYLSSNPLTVTGYETIVLDSGIGSYSDGPKGIMLYGDSNGAYLYGGGNLGAAGSGGVYPEAVLVSTDATVPLSDIFDYTEEAGNNAGTFTLSTGQYLYIGSPYKVKWFYFTVDTANTSTSTMSMACWEGSWTSETITDGTSSGGKTLAQTGGVYTQQTNSPEALYLNGQVLFWYRFSISAGSAVISNIKLQCPLQPLTDFWNGSGRTCIAFQVYRDTEYIDFTHHVSERSTEDSPFAARLGGLDASDFVYMMFEEKIMGFNIDMLGYMYSNGYSFGNIDDIEFWDGDSYVSVTGLIDETDLDGSGGSLLRDGAVSWTADSSYTPQKIQKFGVYGYLYRMSFDAALLDTKNYVTNSDISFSGSVLTESGSGIGGTFASQGVEPGDLLYITGSSSNDGIQTIESLGDDTITITGTFATEGTGSTITLKIYRFEEHEGVSVDTINGITAPIDMSGHEGVGFYSGRAMLIKDNKVDYSLPGYPWIFNGVNTSNEGAPNPAPLQFGDYTDITASHALSNRYGSNIIESWVVAKKNATYTLTGSQPYLDYNEPFIIQQMSSTIGCPAPMTMKEVQITLDDVQRNGLMWLSSTGPVIFDGAIITPVRGVENYFDPTKSEYIKTSLIELATAYYDNTHNEYNLIFPSGSSATANNLWLVYDLKHRKWYQKVPAAYPIYTIGVQDSDGIPYSFGHISSGHLMRLDNTQAWDGVAIDQYVTTGLFIPPVTGEYGIWDFSELTSVKLLSDNIDEDADVTVDVYCDNDASPIGTQTVPLDTVSSISRLGKNANALRLKKYAYKLRFATQTDTDKWNPLFYGYKSRYLRED